MHIYTYMSMYIYNRYIDISKSDNRIYSYTIIYSYLVNVNLMLICTELSVLIIYCKYA